jgi:fatty-acyl-CoA synthase
MFQQLLEQLDAAPSGRYDLTSLRFLFTAGAAIPVETVLGFERHGLVLKQGYGQTETSILCCLDATDAVRKAGSVGRPVHHVELRVVQLESLDGPTEGWKDVGVDETGEIVVRGPITMLGYWRRPSETAETLREGWVRTGDLACVDADGFFRLVGRARDMYISGGENVYPAEVEAVFQEHPAVREIAVVAIPDPRWGESGCAFVVPEPGQELDAEALLSWGRERLARFKLPREFVSIDALPRTETGKVQKHRLALPSEHPPERAA